MALAFRDSPPPEYVIIRDVGDAETTEEDDVESELDRALDDKAEIIVIEPVFLGEETARWIKVGNCLHKTCVMSGLICILDKTFDKSHEYIYVTCGMFSVVCASIYAISWQQDPCCKYQVEDNVPELEQLLTNMSSTTPVMLIRRDDSRRKKLHNFVSLIAGVICAWKCYKWVKS